MIGILFFFYTTLVVVSGAPQKIQRIVGGSLTTISEYPYAASLLYGYVSYTQACGGTILNIRTVLTAAHCVYRDNASQWRVRLGSSLANRGGVVYTLASIVIHSSFSTAAAALDNDVALLRTSTAITYISGYIQPASVAGTNYNLADNESVYAIGWGATAVNGAGSEQLRHVELSVVDQAICRSRYAELGWTITDNILCSGWLDEGGRDQCHGDSGGPLIHNSVIVGICSWRSDCAQARYPGISTRVSRFANWIVVNS